MPVISQLSSVLALVLAAAHAPVVQAGEADVLRVTVTRSAAQVYRFDVTVAHADSGWRHYADAWEVLAPDGRVLGRRALLHPHEAEQPFTRSLSGVRIPAGVTTVRIRAHDSVHGFGSRELIVDLGQKRDD